MLLNVIVGVKSSIPCIGPNTRYVNFRLDDNGEQTTVYDKNIR